MNSKHRKTLVAVFAKLNTFEYRGPGSVLAWMSKIAERTVNDWLDYWRAGKRHPRFELPIAMDNTTDAGTGQTSPAGAGLADPAHGPATNLATRERRRRLAAAMATLSEREHLMLMWRFFGGAAWHEIATELGAKSADAVRKECYAKAFPALAAALARS